MAELNENERKILRAILTNAGHDQPLGPERIGSSIYCETLNDAAEPSGIKDGKILSAIISLLANKGFVITDGETIELTKAGFSASQA